MIEHVKNCLLCRAGKECRTARSIVAAYDGFELIEMMAGNFPLVKNPRKAKYKREQRLRISLDKLRRLRETGQDSNRLKEKHMKEYNDTKEVLCQR